MYAPYLCMYEPHPISQPKPTIYIQTTDKCTKRRQPLNHGTLCMPQPLKSTGQSLLQGSMIRILEIILPLPTIRVHLRHELAGKAHIRVLAKILQPRNRRLRIRPKRRQVLCDLTHLVQKLLQQQGSLADAAAHKHPVAATQLRPARV